MIRIPASGLTVVNSKYLDELIQSQSNLRKYSIFFDLVKAKLPKNVRNFAELVSESHAQNLQDLICLDMLEYKQNGFFVEFGATDGSNNSNSFLLEKLFNWSGILCEPNTTFHIELEKNRPNSLIDYRCVFNVSGANIEFGITQNPELSGILKYKNNLLRDDSRLTKVLNIETISLEDLLVIYNAPKIIDILSIDTEGSEFIILQNFPFNKYRFRIIIVEHNFTSDRLNLRRLLTSNGYTYLKDLSFQQDDYYCYL